MKLIHGIFGISTMLHIFLIHEFVLEYVFEWFASVVSLVKSQKIRPVAHDVANPYYPPNKNAQMNIDQYYHENYILAQATRMNQKTFNMQITRFYIDVL